MLQQLLCNISYVALLSRKALDAPRLNAFMRVKIENDNASDVNTELLGSVYLYEWLGPHWERLKSSRDYHRSALSEMRRPSV